MTVIVSPSRAMDFSNNSTVRSPESPLQATSHPDMAQHSQGGSITVKDHDARVIPMGKWTRLFLLLLLGGSLAEAGLGQASLAQVNNGTVIEQNSRPIVIDPAQTRATIEGGVTPPQIAPTDIPESIVIPQAPETSLEELGEVDPDAIAPPVDVPPAVGDLTPPEQSPALETDAAEPLPTAETEAVSPEQLEAETETAEVEASERVYFADKQISFIPPVGFTAMSSEEIRAKFPGAMPPKYAYANEARNVSVGITISDIPLEAEQLPEVKTVLEDFLETSVPGFQWLEHDFVNIGGQDWIKLEFISQTQDQRIHNDMYITSLQGKLLGFNFNANLAVDFALRNLLQGSRKSILLDQTIASDEGLIP